MSDKPSYKQARSERKGSGTMEIEGAIDTTKPKTFTDKSLETPKKTGEKANQLETSPLDKAGPGWKAEPGVAHPEDWPNPHSDTVKT